MRGRRVAELMAERTDKARVKKRGRGRGCAAAGKGKHTGAKPARGAGQAAELGPTTARSAVTRGPVDVTALTVRELADLLGVPAGTVRDHVKAGAPCTAGRPRRLSLIEYAAWLNREVHKRGEAAR